MATAQPRKVIYSTSADRPTPLGRAQRHQRAGGNSPLAVAAFVAPAVAVTFILGRKLLRRGRRAPKAAQSNALPDGAVPAADSLDLLGLEPASQLSAASKAPVPLPLPLFDADIQCSLQQLFRIVMGPDAVFVTTQHSRHSYWDVSIGEWATHADGSVRRRICFTTPLKPQPFGPKQAECIEDYQLVTRDADSFHVSMAATTPNVPYGGSFFQDIQFVGTASPSGGGGCHLRITAEVKFLKRVLGLGGVIRSSATQGMKDTYSTYMDSIRAALDSSSGGGAVASPSAAAASAEAAVNGAPPAGDGGVSTNGVSASAASAHSPASPPGKAQPQQSPPEWVAGSPVALQLWQRWFRHLAMLALLAVSLWLMRRAVEGAAGGAAAAAAVGAGSGPGFWQGRRVGFAPGSTWPQLQATPAAARQ